MPASRPFLSHTLLLLLLFQFLFLFAISSSPIDNGNDDMDGLEELLAIDEEEEEGQKGGGTGAQGKPSEAEVLSRAQRIVHELSNENAKKVIDGNELVLVLGYAPWCPRSAELMPRFAEAAMILKEMGCPLLLAKLDAERHTKAASLLGIKGFPTVLLFLNGSAQTYTGGFTAEEIVVWARKKTGVPVIRLSSTNAAEEFHHKHQTFIIGLFENYEGTEYEEFVKAATTDNEIQFVETNDISVAKVLFPDIKPKKNFLGLVKSEPESIVFYSPASSQTAHCFIVALVICPCFAIHTLTSSSGNPSEGSNIDALSPLVSGVGSGGKEWEVFIFAEADDFEHLQLLLQNVARKYKTKIMFVLVDSAEDNLAKPFLTLFGIESEKQVVTAFDNRNGSKYLLESDLTESNLEEFCSGLLHGTLSPYFKSEPKPVEVFIFAEADDFEHLQLLLQNVARKYKTKIMFVLVDSAEDNLAKPFLTLFGIESEKQVVTAFDNRNGSKYLLESDLTESNLEEFCSGLLHGTLSPYFKSEPKPVEGGLVEKVVGRTFDASVLDSAENVFLELYTPWCIDCEATSKQIEKLANHFKGLNNLKFARIDASLNEHPKLQVNNYPTLLFYPAGDKSNPVEVSKKSGLKELAAFIKENMRSQDGRAVSRKDEL
ncbi:putative thiol-disulfide exchange intermediate protein [Cocos nucifera]|uniref:protein disulfide-isomerase n=1 Tax=Cocos nucifera TaxID=13894 RepID=A0A8K0I3D2_COCNU|nr:putative thiol-disulfide exchange intermediate protein [Cocos nucifera]